MFNLFKKKSNTPDGIILGSPLNGKVIPLSEVNDETFASGMLGLGVAVVPVDGKVYAPADGKLETVFGTKHAVSMTTKDGVEVLIHFGLDTVELNGECFETHVNEGDEVKKGDLLITADVEGIKAKGYDVTTSMIICNTDDYNTVEAMTTDKVVSGDDILRIVK